MPAVDLEGFAYRRPSSATNEVLTVMTENAVYESFSMRNFPRLRRSLVWGGKRRDTENVVRLGRDKLQRSPMWSGKWRSEYAGFLDEDGGLSPQGCGIRYIAV